MGLDLDGYSLGSCKLIIARTAWRKGKLTRTDPFYDTSAIFAFMTMVGTRDRRT